MMMLAGRFTAAAAAIMLLLALPAAAQENESVEALKSRIASLEEMNTQLRQQVKKLKRELAAQEGSVAAVPPPEPPPADAEEDQAEMTAIEQALTSRGIAVLSPWKTVVEPGFGWSRSGSGSLANDSYAAYLRARMGLPYEAMISVDLPYVVDTGDRSGNRSGVADPSIRLTKQILGPSDDLPTVVANLGYVSNILDTDLSGFSSLTAGLSLSKNVDPVVFFGSFNVGVPFEKEIDGQDVRPGLGYYVGGGASLAVTPEISTSLSLSLGFLGDWTADSDEIDESDRTVGYLRHNWDFVINRHLDVSLSAAIGVTDDSEDFSFAVGFPVKF